MKKIALPVLGIFGLTTLSLFAFTNPNSENNDDKCHIKIVKIVNGVETVVDSTFDCDEAYSFKFDDTGEVDIKSEMKVMMMGDDKNINIDSLIEALGVDIKFDGDNQMRVIKKVMKDSEEGESFEMKWNTEDENVFIDIDDNGNKEEVKIIKKVDDDGKVTVQKWVNGEEVEPTEEDIKNKVVMVKVAEGKNMRTINVGEGENEVSVDMDLEVTENGTTKHIVVITNVTTKEIEKDMPEVATNISKNKLDVEKLTFSPNPNNGKFDLRFNTNNKKEPISVKIFDMQGKEVYTETVNKFNGNYSNNIDISENGIGTYILQILQGDKSKTSKVVIK